MFIPGFLFISSHIFILIGPYPEETLNDCPFNINV